MGVQLGLMEALQDEGATTVCARSRSWQRLDSNSCVILIACVLISPFCAHGRHKEKTRAPLIMIVSLGGQAMVAYAVSASAEEQAPLVARGIKWAKIADLSQPVRRGRRRESSRACACARAFFLEA